MIDMNPMIIFFGVVGAWLVSECVILTVKRSKPAEATRAGAKSDLIMTLSLAISPFLAGLLSGVPATKMPASIRPYAFWGGLALIAIGFTIRLIAIFTLRRYFTVDVAIAKDHRVIDHGVYGVIRHPSYAGSILSFLGLGLAFMNWLSLAIMIVGPAIGIGWRIIEEERALIGALGDDYRSYAARTKRLIPGVF